MKLTLEDIIQIADDAYPDGLVGRAFKDGGKIGDTLAEFIANELRETFEGETDVDQIANACHALRNATLEIGAVTLALHRLGIELARIDGIPKKDLPLYVNEPFEFELSKEHYAKRLKG